MQILLRFWTRLGNFMTRLQKLCFFSSPETSLRPRRLKPVSPYPSYPSGFLKIMKIKEEKILTFLGENKQEI